MGVVAGMNAPNLPGLRFRSPAWTALVSVFIALLPFPARAFLGVFQDNAGIQQLLPDLIGARKIAVFFGLSPLGNQALDVAVGYPGLLASDFEHSEYLVEALQKIQGRAGISLPKLAGIHRRISVPDEFEYRRQSFRGIQVVIQALLELV